MMAVEKEPRGFTHARCEPLGKCMKAHIETCLTWMLVRYQILAANLNPDVLQWPGGSFIALLLCFASSVRVADSHRLR